MRGMCLESSLKNAKSTSVSSLRSHVDSPDHVQLRSVRNEQSGSGRSCRPARLCCLFSGTGPPPARSSPELLADCFLSATLGQKGTAPGSVANTLSSRTVHCRGRETTNGSRNISRRLATEKMKMDDGEGGPGAVPGAAYSEMRNEPSAWLRDSGGVGSVLRPMRTCRIYKKIL